MDKHIVKKYLMKQALHLPRYALSQNPAKKRNKTLNFAAAKVGH